MVNKVYPLVWGLQAAISKIIEKGSAPLEGPRLAGTQIL